MTNHKRHAEFLTVLLDRLTRAATALARRQPGTVVLRQERTPTDLRSVTARLGPQGDLIVEGHDLGKGVESLSGYREYEWTVTVAAIDTPKLVVALQARRDPFAKQRRRSPLRALQRRFSGDKAGEIEAFLKDKGIPYSFWNRIGD